MRNFVIWGVALTSLVGMIGYRALADDASTKPSDVKVIVDFDKDGADKLVKGGDDFVAVAIDPSHATTGKNSLKISCPKDNDYCPIDIVGDAIKGWDKDKYKYFAVDFTTDTDITMPVTVEVMDASSTNFKTRASVADLGPIKKGKVTIVAALADFQRNDKSSPIDLSKITKCRVIVHTDKAELVTYMDNVRLTNEAPK